MNFCCFRGLQRRHELLALFLRQFYGWHLNSLRINNLTSHNMLESFTLYLFRLESNLIFLLEELILCLLSLCCSLSHINLSCFKFFSRKLVLSLFYGTGCIIFSFNLLSFPFLYWLPFARCRFVLSIYCI